MIDIIIHWAIPIIIYSVIAFIYYRLGFRNGYQVAEMTIKDRSIEIDGRVAYIGIINAQIDKVIIATDDNITIYEKAKEF